MSDFEKWGLDPKRVPAAVRASEEPIVRFFAWHDMHPAAAAWVLMEKFETDWIWWEPPTLKKEIVETFKATSISEHNWNKIQAVRTLLTSDVYWEHWESFEKIIQALNNNIPKFDTLQICTLPQLMAGADIAANIKKDEYGPEVAKYVATCTVESGVMYLPRPLEFARTDLSRPRYICKDCGTIESIDDDDDGRCDFCTGRFMDQHNLNGQPAPWIPLHVGKNRDEVLTRDPVGVKERYLELLRLPPTADIDDESAEDVQAAKLVVAYRYMAFRRQQLVEQLKELAKWVTN